MSKSSFVDEILKTYEDPDVIKGKEITKIAEEIMAKHKVKISPSLVYKRIKRLKKQGIWKSAEVDIPKPAEPIINIEAGEKIEVVKEEEKPAEEPSEEPSKKPLEETTPLVEEPPTEEPPTEEKPQMTAEDVEDLCNMGFSRLNAFTDWDGWSLTEDEKERWCPRCADMINKYAPDLLTQYFPEITFAVMTVSIFGGKVACYRKFKEEKEEKEKPAEEKHDEEAPEEKEATVPEAEPPKEKTREEKEEAFRRKVARM